MAMAVPSTTTQAAAPPPPPPPPPIDEKTYDPEIQSHDPPVAFPPSKADGFGQRPVVFRNLTQEVSFVFIATMAVATNSFLVGALVVITAAIGTDLDMSQSQISWIAAGTTLTAGAFQLAFGQLSDLIGRKIMLISGFAIFSAGCLIVSFARNAYWVNVLCGVLGIASAMVVPPAIGILGAAYETPSRRKNIAFACFSTGNPLGHAAGSLTSGVASRIFDWRAGFILLAIIWAVLCVVSYWVVPSVEAYEPSSTMSSRLKVLRKNFDFVGMLMTVLGVGTLTTALTLGPADGWRSAHVIAMMVVGFLLLVGFIFWESYWPHPLMPLHVWKDTTFTLLILIAILGIMAFLSSNFWLSLLMQEVRHLDALEVAVHLLPQVICGVIWNIVAASTLHIVPNNILVAIGAFAYVAGTVLLAVQDAHSNYWAFAFPSLAIIVIGADFHFNVTNSLPSHQQSLAGGIFNMLIRLGTTLSFGISTAVYSSIAERQRGEDVDEFSPFRGAFYVSVGFAALACVFLPFLRLGTQGNVVHADKEPVSSDPQMVSVPDTDSSERTVRG